MNKAMKDLLVLANKIGNDTAQIIGSGGNVSYKEKNFLWVKQSGVEMKFLEEDDLVGLKRPALAAMLGEKYPKGLIAREELVGDDLLSARMRGESEKLPSVDALLHEVMPQAFVLHSHPVVVSALVCAKNGKAAAAKLFGKKALWIDAAAPGYSTAVAVAKGLEEYKAANKKDAAIILIQNHGLVVGADSVSGLDKLNSSVLRTIAKAIKAAKPAKVKPLAEDSLKLAAALAPAVRMITSGGYGNIVTFSADGILGEVAGKAAWIKNVSTALTPDHSAYCGLAICRVEAKKDLDAQYKALEKQITSHQKKYGESPRVVVVDGLGVFTAGCTRKGAERAKTMFIDAATAAKGAGAFGGVLPIAGKALKEIQNWSHMIHHRAHHDCGCYGRIDEKIVIVTGSAQGFGQGVAEELLAEGANVVIADLNIELAKANAAKYCEEFGAGKAIAVSVNVGDADSVEQMVRQTVLEYGGLDVLVSNAGVLRAGGLDKMDTKTFEFMTKINYTGYFICAQKASDVMKIQHRFAPEYTADIIQVNSKSGLSGSKNNFAYAGGKFGGIGLTQSFALELVEWNIKVNSICPGNFFDGPLWSDPKNGLFVQYLKAGKVAGAKTVEDVKRSYESKVPMNRGCGVVDVARAILYVIEQQYETGQAIPVTGGQNMLK